MKPIRSHSLAFAAAGLFFAAAAPSLPLDESRLEPQALSISHLPVSPGERVDSFAVLNDQIFFSAVTAQGGTLYGVTPGPVDSQRVLLGQYQAISLHPHEGSLVFFDMPSRSVIRMEPESGRVLESQDARPLFSFRSLAGNQTIASWTARERVFPQRSAIELERREQLAQKSEGLENSPKARESYFQWLAELEKETLRLGAYDVFLLNQDYGVERPLLETRVTADERKAETGSESMERVLATRHVRLDPVSQRFVAFSQNRPGIFLFDSDGALLRELDSPGEGMIFESDGSMDGQLVQVQRDVLLGEDHLLVVDNPGNTLWMLDHFGRKIQRFALPFVTDNLQRDGDSLYLRGAANDLARFAYPSVPSTLSPAAERRAAADR